MHEENRHAYRVFGGKARKKERPLGRPRSGRRIIL
jgi:hypothetical protein